MKRVLSYVLIMVLLFSCACSSPEKEETSDTSKESNVAEKNNEEEKDTEGKAEIPGAKIPEDAKEWEGHYYYAYNAKELGDAWPAFAEIDNPADRYQNAQEFCESLGGHLAIIESEAENDFLYQAMAELGYSYTFFGLTDEAEEGHWTWYNGEEPAYTNWHEGEPNSENPMEDYAMFYFQDSPTWNDGDFGGNNVNGDAQFICEWEAE